MLRHLSVKNYALIDSAEISFLPGLTAITGETGSGKSILLGAFALLLGERSDHRSIRDPRQKCIAEAQFEIREDEFGEFFKQHDLDFETLTTIRREIGAGGKNRAFVNDTPVSLTSLKALGEQLVDVHSQHENSILGERNFQFSIIDAFGETASIRKEYAVHFTRYRVVLTELSQARDEEFRAKQNLDFIVFQLNELTHAGLDEINQLQLEQELETLTHSGTIRAELWAAAGILDSEPQGTLTTLNSARQHIQKIAAFHPALTDFADRLESVLIECRELKNEMNDFAENTESDEERIAHIQHILNEVYRLQQKHRLNTVEELRSLRDQLGRKAQEYVGLDHLIKSLEKEVEILRDQLRTLADALHKKRIKGAQKAENLIQKFLNELQLEHAVLHWELTEAADFMAHGCSEIRLLFRANRGGLMQPIRNVASGGEISRVMLALKAAIAHYRRLPVLILDEIDQGVSGEVALRIGSILREMSKDIQLITITHLPQIAGKADHHFKVFKTDDSEHTQTRVIPLNGEQRVEELAEMLGGKKRSQTSVEHARELLIRS